MIPLNDQQTQALDEIENFVLNPNQQVHVLEGYSGTGKSTLIQHFLDRLPAILKTMNLVDPKFIPFDVLLTATTHKAAENLFVITGVGAATIHSTLGLNVKTDFKTGESTLTQRFKFDKPQNSLILIDEASQLNEVLLDYVFSRTMNCKILFIGDPAQITARDCVEAPVFDGRYPTSKLTKVERNGGKILELATMFRNAVETGEWKSFEPDGAEIVHVSRPEFNKLLEAEFTRADWKPSDSRFLAWTNKRVIEYNDHIRGLVVGTPHFEVGDYGKVNTYVRHKDGEHSLSNDSQVLVESVSEPLSNYGVVGRLVHLKDADYFLANDYTDVIKALAKFRKAEYWAAVAELSCAVDLRPVFAQTINKSQGSTYEKVFVDIDDLARCRDGNQVARMGYVGISRARKQVILTGDF